MKLSTFLCRESSIKQPLHPKKLRLAGSRNFVLASKAAKRAASDRVRKGFAPLSVQYVADQTARMVAAEGMAPKGESSSPLVPSGPDVTQLTAPVQEAGLLQNWASRVVPDTVFQSPMDGTGVESAAVNGRRALQHKVAAKHGVTIDEATQLRSIPAKSQLDKEVDAMMQHDRTEGPRSGKQRDHGSGAAVFFHGEVRPPPNFQEFILGHKKDGDEIHKFGDGRTTLNSLKAQFLWPFNAKDVVDQHHMVNGRIPAHRLVELQAQRAAVAGRVDPGLLAKSSASQARTIQQVVFGHGGKGDVLGSATSRAVASSIRDTLPPKGSLARAVSRAHDDVSGLLPSAEQLLSSIAPEIEAAVYDQLEDDAAKHDTEDQLERGIEDARSLAFMASQRGLQIQDLSHLVGSRSTLLATMMKASAATSSRQVPNGKSDGLDAGKELAPAGSVEHRHQHKRAEQVHTPLLSPTEYGLLHHKYGKVVQDITDASITDKTDGEAAKQGARDLGVGFLGGQTAAINTIKFRVKQAVKEVIRKGPPNLQDKAVFSVLRDFTTTLPLVDLYPPDKLRLHSKSSDVAKPAAVTSKPGATSNIIASLTGTVNLMANFNNNGKYALSILTSSGMVALVQQLAKLVYWKIIRAEADGTPMGLNADPVLLGTDTEDALEAEMSSLAAQASAPSIKHASQLSRKGAGVHYDVTAEGKVSVQFMLLWQRIQSGLIAHGTATMPTTRTLCLTALKACVLKLLDTCYPEWFGLERSLKVYWRMYTTDHNPSHTLQSNPGAMERASLFLSEIGADARLRTQVAATDFMTENDLRNPNLPLALREAIRLNNILEFRVPKLTSIDLQTDSFVARLLDPGRFGSIVPKFAADDDGRLQALALHNLHNPYNAFKEAMFGSPGKRHGSTAPSASSPQSPTHSLALSPVHGSPSQQHPSTMVASDFRVPIPVDAAQAKMKGPVGSPYRSLQFKYTARHHMQSVEQSKVNQKTKKTSSSLGQKLKQRPRFVSEGSTESEFEALAYMSRNGQKQPAHKALETIRSTAAIRPLPAPKQVTNISFVTTANVRGALPVPTSSNSRRTGAIAGQRFHSRKTMVRLHEPVVELDTDVCAQASVENVTQLVGSAMPMMSPVRASADVRSSKLLKAAANSGLTAYKQRMHAGFVSPQAAGVPAVLFSPKQRVALLKGSLHSAAKRYAGGSTSSSKTKRMANADRYHLLRELAGGSFEAKLEESEEDEVAPASEIQPRAFYEDEISYASESDDDENRPTNLYASSSKRYTDDGERIQHGVRDLVDDVQREVHDGNFDPSFGAVGKDRLVSEARSMLQKQMSEHKEQQTWGDYDPSRDPVALNAHEKNDWYVEGIGRRTKLVDNPFGEETTDKSAESKIDTVAALGIPRREDLLKASRFGALKASQKDLMVAKVMRKRNPGARRLLKRLVKDMGAA